MINQQQEQYLKEIGFTPAIAAVINIMFRMGNIPAHYLNEYQNELNEAIVSGFITLDENDTLQLTHKAANTLETILILRGN